MNYYQAKRYNKIYYMYLNKFGQLRVFKNGVCIVDLKNCNMYDFKYFEGCYFGQRQ